MKPWVATVSPKEYAQNISDVSSNQQIRQLSTLLSASDGKGGSIDAQAESFKQEQAIAHAIKRQPLAASFVGGGDKFGWVLGPKYEIEGAMPSFLHSTSRYTFTASVVVPGWLSEIELSGCGYWVDSNGKRSTGFPLFQSSSCSSTVEVRLPHGYRAILHALMDSNFDILFDPEIFLLPDADAQSGVMTVRATPDACIGSGDKSCEQMIVIEGRDLWRNPAVFIGNQRADRIDVLPSMRGIVATFKTLRLPAPGRGGRVGLQDLFVSTSAGQDRLDDAVYITTTSSSPNKPFSCLSHDIVAHETTHALLDGMHRSYVEDNHPDTLAFHEAFADLVALLQHFTIPEVLAHQIARTRGDLQAESLLGQLAVQFGEATGRYGALRDAIGEIDADGRWKPLRPDPQKIQVTTEPHGRGAILVAAVFGAFTGMYKARSVDLIRLSTAGSGVLPDGAIHPDLVERLSTEASKVARQFLNICIRALERLLQRTDGRVVSSDTQTPRPNVAAMAGLSPARRNDFAMNLKEDTLFYEYSIAL